VPWNYLDNSYVNVDDVMNQKDVLHCGCRAYGRMKEGKREDLAVHCYGYVILTQSQEDDFR